MPKNAVDVVAMAHRRIRILSVDEAPSADQTEFGTDILDALFAELKQTDGMAFTWTLDAVPDGAFLPLSFLLATEIAPHYERPSERRSQAMGRLRAYAFPDDRADRRDTDDDGAVTDAEITANLRTAFY